MNTLKDKMKNKIDRAAEKTKRVAAKGIDQAKRGIKKVGDKVIRFGSKIKARGINSSTDEKCLAQNAVGTFSFWCAFVSDSDGVSDCCSRCRPLKAGTFPWLHHPIAGTRIFCSGGA